MKSKIEVCYSPALYQYYRNDDAIVVVTDILRATTAICAAFDNGVDKLIPVAGIDEAKKWKERGYLVAAERDGIVLDFADFGNSPFNFQTDKVKGETIVYSTTNGTQAIKMAEKARSVVVGAFTNLGILNEWLVSKSSDVVILCAGWKNRYNLEDSLFAGALSKQLLESGRFFTDCDSATAAVELWDVARDNISEFFDKAAHRHRLKKLNLDDVLEYCQTIDAARVLPVLSNGVLIDHCVKKSQF